MAEEKKRAVLYAPNTPSQEQEEQFLCFLREKYGPNVTLDWERRSADGFRLEVDMDVYDWTVSGKLRQMREMLSELPGGRRDVIPLVKEAVQN